MSITLQVTSQGKDGKVSYSESYEAQSLNIGRMSDNNVQLVCESVSKKHANITYEDGDWYVEDLGSKHGTFLNGNVIVPNEKRKIKEGDELKIVQTSIVITELENTAYNSNEQTVFIAKQMVQEAFEKEEPNTFIYFTKGPLEGEKRNLQLQNTHCLIGRSVECQVQIDDESIEDSHCLIKQEMNSVFISPFVSSSSLLINSEKIEIPVEIKKGDIVTLGLSSFIYGSSDKKDESRKTENKIKTDVETSIKEEKDVSLQKESSTITTEEKKGKKLHKSSLHFGDLVMLLSASSLLGVMILILLFT